MEVNKKARIIVIGVGGGGNNAVNRMLDDNIESVEFFVMNTDNQSLQGSKVPQSNRVLLGPNVTFGLGAGGDSDVGKRAAEDSEEEIRRVVKGANMVFIAAGMGGGTGTGAAPVIAQICRSEGALTVAISTRPFSFEGKKRLTNANDGFHKLKEACDAIIIVSNDKLLMADGSEYISTAFQNSDKILAQSVKTVTDLIFVPGIINLDFADIRNVLSNSGVALIGYGIGEGASKASDAANEAISSSLLEASIAGARRAICAVTCGPSVSLFEAEECVNNIVEAAGNGLDVKLGVSINEELGDQILVSVIASDFETEANVDNPMIGENVNKPKVEVKTDNKKNIQDEKKEEKGEEDILPSFLKGLDVE